MIGEHELTMPGGLAHIGEPPDNTESVLDRLPRKVKRHFLESELVTAADLVEEYTVCVNDREVDPTYLDSTTRQKLIWLLERLQESVL